MNFSKKLDEKEIRKINRLQRDFFSGLIHVFDPPLPEGVPQRLEQIVASACIREGDTVLDVGSGTGILIPLIQAYRPEAVFACDLSEPMLEHLKKQYPYAKTMTADVRDITLPDNSIDVVFMNACYPNIVDKDGSLSNIGRMIKPHGRIVISHPLGKSFIDSLKESSPFPLDDFPGQLEAEILLRRYGFEIEKFIDEPKLYVLVGTFRPQE